MTRTPATYYAINQLITGRIVYLGTSEQAAAEAQVPGTLLGTGPSKSAAKLAVEQQLALARATGRLRRARLVHP